MLKSGLVDRSDQARRKNYDVIYMNGAEVCTNEWIEGDVVSK